MKILPRNSILSIILFTFILLFIFFTYVLTVDIYQNDQYKKGSFVHYEKFPSDNVSTRPVDIWLPEGYFENADRHYPVIYLHDGQGMFNKETSPQASIWYRPLDWLWGGIFWDLDASISKLVSEGKIEPAILVSIWNTPGKRALEFMPKKPVIESRTHITEIKEDRLTLFGKLELGDSVFTPEMIISDNYLKFIVEELKPFVDLKYRTKPNRENTFIMGSSKGGLISAYAISEYPEVFGGAACLSTDWSIGKGAEIAWFQTNWPVAGSHRIYFDVGTGFIDTHYEPYQNEMDKVMIKHGYTDGKDWVTKKFEGAGHFPKQWRSRMHIPLIFLLGQN